MPQEDRHTLCARCLGVHHATSALGDETFCDICAAFQHQVLRKRLDRAMGMECLSPVAEPQIVKPSRQARDIMDLKAQMAQVMELLVRQQTAATPSAVPTVPVPVPAHVSPKGVQNRILAVLTRP
ncbi:UNVERIFIED_CONTAM: hypothetical protein FKN15_072411 [Acipenser sinensis]